MTIHKRISMLTGIVMMLASQMGFADRINQRQLNQRERIHQGVKSGELTKGEAARLRAGERHIRRMERRAKADGTVTDKEAARIENAQDRESARIYNQKHDEQKRGD